MKKMIPRMTLVLVALVLAHLGAGCATSRDYRLKCKPVTTYPQTELLDLSVAVELRHAFAGGVVFERPPIMLSPGVRYFVPGALEASAEALARSLFQRVSVVKGPASGAARTFDALIRPHVATVEEAYNFKGGVTLVLEWTVTRPGGELVWKKTITGEGTGSISQKTLFQRAMEDAFQRSFEQMSRSPEIRALPLTRPGTTPGVAK